jgi:hypothetical protein
LAGYFPAGQAPAGARIALVIFLISLAIRVLTYFL